MKTKRRNKADAIEAKNTLNRMQVLSNLSAEMLNRERRLPIPFNDFMYFMSCNPENIFRNVFQLFYDMVHYYIPNGIEEYPDAENSVGFKGYDPTNLFVVDCDDPFFSDRLFTNRLMNLVQGFKEGSIQNHIFLFEGPPGSGKSTFLNNILYKLEEYTRTQEGTIYKTYWRLEIEKLGGFQQFGQLLAANAMAAKEDSYFIAMTDDIFTGADSQKKYLQFSCPKHDHPILQIPKNSRRKFLDELIPDEEFKEKLFYKKEYEWVLKGIPCNICKSLFSTLLDILEDPMLVFEMIYARKFQYNRQFGEGISVYNPGDPVNQRPLTNPSLQNLINSLLKSDNVEFVFSETAKTNNGVLALMDIKDQNVERLKYLHGIISDGVHKIGQVEEHISSLFVGLVNPEDKFHYETVKSFQDRIISVNIPYILDYNTEVAIYKNKFGEDIEDAFLPGVLEYFAKIIISTRLEVESPAIKRWIKNPEIYRKYLDKNMLLLKMDIYTGLIPEWLSEEDLKRFDKQLRKDVLTEAEQEGMKGISGRMSLNVFNAFFSKSSRTCNLITMDCVREFFSEQNSQIYQMVPAGFVDSLISMYNYDVLQDVRESVYYFNEDQISREIINYLFAINFEPDTTEISEFTGDEIEITAEYFDEFEELLLGEESSQQQREEYRRDLQNEYISKTLAQEIGIRKRKITQTEQFKALFEKYTRNLKENALSPYLNNENFRRAIMAYGTKGFKTYDSKIRQDVGFLISNLKSKFNYTAEGAKQVSLYVLDNKLTAEFD